MSRACRLVSDDENLQPKFPVQATRPVRTSVAFQPKPRASTSLLTVSIRSSAMSEISTFCQTVKRIVPLPWRSAIAARPRIWSHDILPTGSTTPA